MVLGLKTMNSSVENELFIDCMLTFFYIMLLEHNLDAGRKKLIEDRVSERFKLETPDGNYLDTMFVDNRGKT